MKYREAFITDTGNMREKNEDSLLVCRRKLGKEEILLAAVADGMGGLCRGEYASQYLVENLRQWWQREIEKRTCEPDLTEISDSLGFIIERCHGQLLEEGKRSGMMMGTTLSLVFLWKGEYIIKQVGDSRIYLLAGHQTYQLTTDQSWCQQEVDAGRMTREEMVNHEKRHILLNALGAKGNFYITNKFGQIGKKQRLLLCSDGYYNYLKSKELYRSIGSFSLQKQLNKSMKRIRKGIAEDNLTAIMVEACNR